MRKLHKIERVPITDPVELHFHTLVSHTDHLRREGFLDEDTHAMFMDFIEQDINPFELEPVLRLIVRRYFKVYKVMYNFVPDNGYIQHQLIDKETIDRIWKEEYLRQAKEQLWINHSLLNEIFMVRNNKKPNRKNDYQESGFRDILNWAKDEIEYYINNYGYCFMDRFESVVKNKRKEEIKTEKNPEILTGKKMAISHLKKSIESLKNQIRKKQDRHFKDLSLKEFLESKKQTQQEEF